MMTLAGFTGNRSLVRAGAALLFATVSLFLPHVASAAQWPTFDGNPARAAWLNSDHSVNRGNVGHLRMLWQISLDAMADSTPIYAASVTRRGGASGPMIFQTDGVGKTYGIDATTGNIVWRFSTSGPKITASTPVMDPSGTALYVPAVDGFIHKVDAATGAELTAAGFPAQLTLEPVQEKDASPLNVANGYLYAATSGYIGDAPPYDGHVIVVRLSDGNTNVFNSLCANMRMLLQGSQCAATRSGIWARGGVVVDPDQSMNGRVYFASGNGPFNMSAFNYSDTAFGLSADGSKLLETFTPPDYLHLQNADLDLGSSAPAMLPKVARSRTPLMAVEAGKGQVLDLLDRTNFGGIGGQIQRMNIPFELFTAPAVWQTPAGEPLVVLGFAPSSEVMAFRLETSSHGISRLHSAWTASVKGTSPVISGGIVFVAASGVISALDVRDGKVLWQSTQQSAGGTIGSIHWQSPIVVNGAVYCSDSNGKLTAYSVN